MNDKFKTYKESELLVSTVLESVRQLDKTKLKTEKYNLVGMLKEQYSLKTFLKTKITNYTLLASIYKLFEHNKGKNISPSEIVSSKTFLINHILSNTKVSKQEELQEYKQLDEDLRMLTYKLIVEKFNSKYINLEENQKDILKNYIYNISNSVKLKEYIDKKILDIRVKFSNIIPTLTNTQLKVKLEQLTEQIHNNFKGATSTETHILNIMRYYQIINDLKKLNNETK